MERSFDLLTQFALLARRLAAANYNLNISADVDLPEEEDALLDNSVTIPMSQATGIVAEDSVWDGFVRVEVRLEDLGYRPRCTVALQSSPIGRLRFSVTEGVT